MPKIRPREQGEALEVSTGDELLTVREVARFLRCDKTTIRRWIKQGVLEAVVLPHKNKREAYRIKRSIIDGLTTPRTLERSRG